MGAKIEGSRLGGRGRGEKKGEMGREGRKEEGQLELDLSGSSSPHNTMERREGKLTRKSSTSKAC